MLTLAEIATCLGNNPENYLPPDLARQEVSSFCLDSRKVEKDSLFVCISGEKVDGHDFAAQAAKDGACAVLSERDPRELFAGQTPPLAVILVENSRLALARLAAAWRRRARQKGIKVVGITGTAGKTSVKEALAAVLSVRGKTCKNFMNMNNQLGLAISILNAADDAKFWVMEAGISQPHDMDELGAILRPDLAVILNVGPGHVSGLGDKGVAHYKARLLGYVQPDGQALINSDYPELLEESLSYAAPVKQFSSRRDNIFSYAASRGAASETNGRFFVHLCLKNCENGALPDSACSNSDTNAHERLACPHGFDAEFISFKAVAPFRGGFGAENVAAIAGAASLLGLSPEEIAAGLAQAVLPNQRFNCLECGGSLIIDDSYNANPLSAGRMLEAASEMAREKKVPLILVMGEMLELGDVAEIAHAELGKKMAYANAEAVFWKGGQKSQIQAGLRSEGYHKFFRAIDGAAGVEDFISGMRQLRASLGSGGVVLFKGSRGNRLELLVAAFQNEFSNQTD